MFPNRFPFSIVLVRLNFGFNLLPAIALFLVIIDLSMDGHIFMTNTNVCTQVLYVCKYIFICIYVRLSAISNFASRKRNKLTIIFGLLLLG